MGTRPEIIKMAPIIYQCVKKKIPYCLIHTGQHYNYEMDKIFLKELRIDTKKTLNLNIGSGQHGEMTGKMLMAIEKELLKIKPKVVLIEGDTNTVIAGALASVKLQIPIAHVEAGLRSYDRTMPEEHNRIIADHLADFLLAPTKETALILKKEGINSKKIFITGNTIADAVMHNIKISRKKSKILQRLSIKPNKYFLLTLHRQENVDNKIKLQNIFTGLNLLSKKYNIPIIYPIHPRTVKKMKQFKLVAPKGLKIIKPVGFFDFLQLENNAHLVLTDSGGVQEETCILRVPCVTLRENTERPETITVGSNILAGSNPKKILKSVEKMLLKKRKWRNPFGDGTSGKKIFKILNNI